MGEQLRDSTTAIDSSNIGFQLLKKHGWKEGTGLGISEQGRLEPVKTYLKNNKRGLGAGHHNKLLVDKNNTTGSSSSSKDTNNNQDRSSSRKSKALSKKQRKMQELEKRLQEKEFERAFFREFWPDNV